MLKKENVKMRDGDYWEEETLYCGNCHTRRAYWHDKDFGYVYTICDCVKKAKEAEERMWAEELFKMEINRNRRICFCDMRTYRGFTFENINPVSENIEKPAKAYAADFSINLKNNTGLLFWGSSGYGKTTVAACIANAVIDRGFTAKIKNIPQIIYDLQSSYCKNDILRELNTYDLLILDDFGSQGSNSFTEELVFALLESRKNAAKPVIITTNIPLTQFKTPPKQTDRRLYERVLEMCSYPVEFKNLNHRRVEVSEKYKTAQAEFDKYLSGELSAKDILNS